MKLICVTNSLQTTQRIECQKAIQIVARLALGLYWSGGRIYDTLARL